MKERLYKSQQEKMIAGVCGGIAEYFDIDPVFVRLAFVLLAFLHGIGFILYIAGMIIMPRKYHTVPPSAGSESGEVYEEEVYDEAYIEEKNRRSKKAGGILIGAGIIILIINILPSFEFKYVIPTVLVVTGVWLLYNSTNNK